MPHITLLYGLLQGSPTARAALIENFDAILFNHRIGQDFVCGGFDVALRLLASGAWGERNFEKLALAYLGDGGEPEAIEGRAHRLTLRIQHGGLRSYEYASFHGELRLSHAWRHASE